MCLAIPAKLVEAKGDEGFADLHGTLLPVSLMLSPEARVGDWVLVHAGFVIKKLDAAEATSVFSVLKDVEACSGTNGERAT